MSTLQSGTGGADEPPLVAEAREGARAAGLRYTSDEQPGYRRRRAGKSFRYLTPDGGTLADRDELARIRSLAIPPAWTEVWICPAAGGHLQATGRDARGRKQYRYHPDFREVRESTKYQHMLAFARSLPAIRTAVRRHMALSGLPREKVLATVVHLLETTLIRVGNDDYARQNGSYGLTTLKNRHAAINGAEVRFHFKGKSGKLWSLRIRDRRIAKIIRSCQELPGQELLEYLDDHGEPQRVSSSDVNAYLREITGQDITAKDFRTWAGTVMAAAALRTLPPPVSRTAAKRGLQDVIRSVAERLGNTPAICRKCYIHPKVVDAYLGARLAAKAVGARRRASGLFPEEAAILKLLRTPGAPAVGTPSGLRAALRATIAMARARPRS